MPSAFVDSNILIYAAEESSPATRHTLVAREVLRQRELWISVQVLNEFIVNARKPNKLNLSQSQQRQWLEYLQLFQVASVTWQTFIQALIIHTRYQLSHWDSLIIASAKETDCEIIYSEDLSHDQEYDGVKVINPFL